MGETEGGAEGPSLLCKQVANETTPTSLPMLLLPRLLLLMLALTSTENY